MKNNLSFFLLWYLWVLISYTFFYQYFVRVSVGGLSPDLLQQFSLTQVQLNDLHIIYFIFYIIFLPISGLIMDRLGIKISIFLTSILMGISTILFAHANNLHDLMMARSFMGVAAPFSEVGAVAYIYRYLPPRYFNILTGITISFGVLGGLFGEWVIPTLSHSFKWSDILNYAGYSLIILSFILYKLMPKEKNMIEKVTFKQYVNVIDQFFNSFNSWIPGIYGGLLLSVILSYAAFWARPFLKVVFHIDEHTAVFIASLVFLGHAVGSSIWSVLAGKFGVRKMMLCSACFVLIIFLIELSGKWNIPTLCLINLGLGLTLGFSLVAIAVERLSSPEIFASILSFTYALCFIVPVCFMYFTGMIINGLSHHQLIHSLENYSPHLLTLSVQVIVFEMICAIVVVYFIKLSKEDSTKS